MYYDNKCHHLFDDLTFCNRKNGYHHSIYCKKHFLDVMGGTKMSNTQVKRLARIRKTYKLLKQKGYVLHS